MSSDHITKPFMRKMETMKQNSSNNQKSSNSSYPEKIQLSLKDLAQI